MAQARAQAELAQLARTTSGANSSLGKPDERPQYVLKEGYLVKRGHIVKNWKRRYFRLQRLELTYSIG